MPNKFNTWKYLGTLEYSAQGTAFLNLGKELLEGIMLVAQGDYFAGLTAAGTVKPLSAAHLFERIKVRLGSVETIDIAGDSLAAFNYLLGKAPDLTNPTNTNNTTDTVKANLWLPLGNADPVDMARIHEKVLQVNFGNGPSALVSGPASDATLTNVVVKVYGRIRVEGEEETLAPPLLLRESVFDLSANQSHAQKVISGEEVTLALNLLFRQSNELDTWAGNLTMVQIVEPAEPLTAELDDDLLRAINGQTFGLSLHSSHVVVPFSDWDGKRFQGTHGLDLRNARLVYDSASGLTSPSLSVIPIGILPLDQAIGAVYDPGRVPATVKSAALENAGTGLVTKPIKAFSGQLITPGFFSGPFFEVKAPRLRVG